MSDFDHQINVTIQKYLKEVKNESYSIAEIEKRPRWKRVWFWWDALEYYEDGWSRPDLTLDEVKQIYGDK